MTVVHVAAAIDEALTKLGHGSVVSLADICEVAHSTVGTWRSGSRLPRPQRWACIEDFLLLERGTIYELLAEDDE